MRVQITNHREKMTNNKEEDNEENTNQMSLSETKYRFDKINSMEAKFSDVSIMVRFITFVIITVLSIINRSSII